MCHVHARFLFGLLSHIALVASPTSGQSTLASYETSILQTLAQLLVSQLEFLEAFLLKLLVVDLELFMSLFSKTLSV
jgi:hypothetical protein